MHCFLLIGLAPLHYYTLTRSSLRMPRELRPTFGFRVLLCCVDVPLLAFHLVSPVVSSSGEKQGRNQCAASPNLLGQQSLDHDLTSCCPIAIKDRRRVIRLYADPDTTSNMGNQSPEDWNCNLLLERCNIRSSVVLCSFFFCMLKGCDERYTVMKLNRGLVPRGQRLQHKKKRLEWNGTLVPSATIIRAAPKYDENVSRQGLLR